MNEPSTASPPSKKSKRNKKMDKILGIVAPIGLLIGEIFNRVKNQDDDEEERMREISQLESERRQMDNMMFEVTNMRYRTMAEEINNECGVYKQQLEGMKMLQMESLIKEQKKSSESNEMYKTISIGLAIICAYMFYQQFYQQLHQQFHRHYSH